MHILHRNWLERFAALDTRAGRLAFWPSRAEARAPTVALDCARSGQALAAELAPHGIMADGGDFYAVRPLQALGVDLDKGGLRLSFVQYTNRQDIDHLIRTLDHVL